MNLQSGLNVSTVRGLHEAARLSEQCPYITEMHLVLSTELKHIPVKPCSFNNHVDYFMYKFAVCFTMLRNYFGS